MRNNALSVFRTRTTGEKVLVGQLAENAQGCYFQYDKRYLQQENGSLSPFSLKFDSSLQIAPRSPHHGLHGIFADSLPDGWGLYLMDRVFREQGINPANITMLDRLAYVGDRGAGALSYFPCDKQEIDRQQKSLIQLGSEAVKTFEGCESQMLKELSLAAGSGGARPKLNITIDGNIFSTNESALGDKWLIKFTSKEFLLGHEESVVEAIYMKMASHVGLPVAEHKLFDAGSGHYWLGQKRFDCDINGGRLHMHSAAGLLDANFREPSLDYVDLIKACKMLCGASDAQQLLKRAIFNYLLCNQDDHAKNWAFLLDDKNSWSLSPFYDIVYSPSLYGEHMTAYMGNGKLLTKKSLDIMAKHAGLKGSKDLIYWIESVYHEISCFSGYANALNVSKALTYEIQTVINLKLQNLQAQLSS